MAQTALRELIDRGLAAHRRGQLEEALDSYGKALNTAPGDSEATSLLGLVLLHLGRSGEAGPLLQKAVLQDPNHPGFRMNLAEYYERTNQIDAAGRELKAILSFHPDFGRAWERLGDLCVSANDIQGAQWHYAQASNFDAGNHVLALKLARANAALGRGAEARAALAHAAQLSPNNPKVFQLYADVFNLERDWPGLETIAKSWTHLRPDDPAGWRAMAQAAFEQSQPQQAVLAHAKVLELSGRTAEALCVHAQLCMHALDFDNAQKALDEAEALNPQLIELLSARAFLLTYLGRFDEAERYCRRCLSQDPQFLPAYTILTQLTRGALSSEQLDVLTRVADDGNVAVDHRISAAFALGDGYDAKGDIPRAFNSYSLANRLGLERNEREGRRYDPRETVARSDRLMTMYGAALASGEAPFAGGPRPIFIVGIPRSGTTLVESILASHSRVRALGERPRMQQILDRSLAGNAGEPSSEDLMSWRNAYFVDVPDIGPATHFIDKNPLNFQAVGLIARLFPDAVIIHVRRNPLATGFSVFRHEFGKLMTFANELGSIGHYYGEYARLMAHWQATLGDRLITVQYEDLLPNLDRVAADLVAACDLSWEPACLAFASSNRPIATLSAVQVRDALSMSDDRAARYAEFLEPLVRSLRAGNINLTTGALA